MRESLLASHSNLSLVLGVVDVAYTDKGNKTTTGDVAQILEDRYHPMQIFEMESRPEIAAALSRAVQSQISRIVNGKPPAKDMWTGATAKIDELFRDFLDRDVISGILPMTQQITAAQIGKNSRKKSVYNKNNETRPALIDTGLYQKSFKSWVIGS